MSKLYVSDFFYSRLGYRAGILLLLGVLGMTQQLVAQSYLRKENNIWMGTSPYFWENGSTGAGIDFNSGVPQDIFGPWAGGAIWGSMNSGAGDRANGATICDANGHLLFYTDGIHVYDRNFEFMQHGYDMLNFDGPDTFSVGPIFGSSAPNRDGVVAIPMPGSSHKYYIFHSPYLWKNYAAGYLGFAWLAAWQGALYATVVDMELNNGLGAVDTSFQGVKIADSMVGNLHVVTGEDCNYWLLGYAANGSYRAFNITSAGIDTSPVISTLTPLLFPYVFELNVSPDRRKVVLAAEIEAQVADFDPATGVLSNDFMIGCQGCRFGAFSPNNQFLYLSGLIGIRQHDINDISNPLTVLSVNDSMFEFDSPIRLGPDGKIYFSYIGPGVVTAAHIQQPDVYGLGCQMELIPGSLALLDQGFNSLPNEVAIIVYDTASVIREVPICFQQPPTLSPGVTGTDYHWMVNTVGTTFVRKGDDSTDSLEAIDPGIYAVQYFTTNPCTFHRDTFIVEHVNYSLYLGPDQVSCDGTPVQLEAGAVDGATYLWQDNSSSRQFLATTSGIYWVEVAKQGCSIRDSVAVDIIDIHQELGEDTMVCIEEAASLSLHVNVPAGGSVLWNTGATLSSIHVADSGMYWVDVTYKQCKGSDTIRIQQRYCDCPIRFPNAFSPNGDGINDYFEPVLSGACPVANYRLEIYDRWGQRVFVAFKPEDRWDGTYKGQHADVGTYMYRVQARTGLRRQDMQQQGDLTLLR